MTLSLHAIPTNWQHMGARCCCEQVGSGADRRPKRNRQAGDQFAKRSAHSQLHTNRHVGVQSPCQMLHRCYTTLEDHHI